MSERRRFPIGSTRDTTSTEAAAMRSALVEALLDVGDQLSSQAVVAAALPLDRDIDASQRTRLARILRRSAAVIQRRGVDRNGRASGAA